MRVIDPGHRYELLSLDGEHHQELVFVKREGDHYPGNIGRHPGTTSQDVLRCLIERARYVNMQLPCAETEAAIALMQTCVLLFEQRAHRVRGETLSLEMLRQIEAARSCPTCGHVYCTKNH